MDAHDWQPIETLPNNRVADLIALRLQDGSERHGWMNTSLSCAPRVFFCRTIDDEVKYVMPVAWREIEAPARARQTDDYTACVY